MVKSAPDLVRVAVVGGGLSGLSVTYELVRRTRLDSLPLEIRLFEAEQRFGGVIRSELFDGFLLEHGPSSFSTVDEAGLRLVAELGLQAELIPARSDRGALVWWDGKLHGMPPGLVPISNGTGSRRALFNNTLLSARGKLRAGFEPAIPGRRRKADESIAAFVSRRFGRQMLERVGEPLLAGAVGGDPAVLAARHAAPEITELERRYGSIGKGLREVLERDESRFGVPLKATRSAVVSFRRGMQTLVDAVAEAIARNDPGALGLGRRVIGLRPAGDPLGAAAYALDTDDGETWIADICVLTVPSRSALRLVNAFAPEVGEALSMIPHSSTIEVCLGYGRGVAVDLPDAIECLVPASQERPILGCTFAHREFDLRAPHGGALLRVRMGGARNPSLVDWDDDTAVRTARREVKDMFGIGDPPLLARVIRRRRGHPQYLVDHGARLETIERELALNSGLLIAGRSLYGSAVSQVIANGRATGTVAAELAHTRLA